jgi:hypothetical protein
LYNSHHYLNQHELEIFIMLAPYPPEKEAEASAAVIHTAETTNSVPENPIETPPKQPTPPIETPPENPIPPVETPPIGLPATPEATVTAPEATVTAPEATVTAPEATVTAPEATVTAPEATVTAPEVTVTAPEATVTPTEATVTPTPVLVMLTREELLLAEKTAMDEIRAAWTKFMRTLHKDDGEHCPIQRVFLPSTHSPSSKTPSTVQNVPLTLANTTPTQ